MLCPQHLYCTITISKNVHLIKEAYAVCFRRYCYWCIGIKTITKLIFCYKGNTRYLKASFKESIWILWTAALTGLYFRRIIRTNRVLCSLPYLFVVCTRLLSHREAAHHCFFGLTALSLQSAGMVGNWLISKFIDVSFWSPAPPYQTFSQFGPQSSPTAWNSMQASGTFYLI